MRKYNVYLFYFCKETLLSLSREWIPTLVVGEVLKGPLHTALLRLYSHYWLCMGGSPAVWLAGAGAFTSVVYNSWLF